LYNIIVYNRMDKVTIDISNMALTANQKFTISCVR